MQPFDDNPLFAGVGSERRAALYAAGRRRTYAAREVILSAGQIPERVFLLEAGSVRVFHQHEAGSSDDSAAAEIVVKVFGAPALFGEAEALCGIPYVQSAAALSRCEMLELPIASFVGILREAPSVCMSLCLDLAKRLAISSYDERSIAFDPATVRLANYLLDYAEWMSVGKDELSVDLTQADMARAIGVTRRSIAKDVAAWQDEGILERSAKGYRLRRPDGLRRYADSRRMNLHHRLKPA